MSLISKINTLFEEEERIAKKAKDYNAKKAEYNKIRLKSIDNDAIEEHYTSIKQLERDQVLLEDMYLELSYEHNALVEEFENFNNKRSAMLNE
ncbi:hypothetical protein [Staphylococcus sp. FSL W8-0774]|uniref:hypothetical protein n=1 Tax=Staphylococcus sp. FSL W8-0774 TaxID=2954632 RepID=UPI0030FADFB7